MNHPPRYRYQLMNVAIRSRPRFMGRARKGAIGHGRGTPTRLEPCDPSRPRGRGGASCGALCPYEEKPEGQDASRCIGSRHNTCLGRFPLHPHGPSCRIAVLNAGSPNRFRMDFLSSPSTSGEEQSRARTTLGCSRQPFRGRLIRLGEWAKVGRCLGARLLQTAMVGNPLAISSRLD
jgi:hypothetical protein